jgi:hypothetical protein
MLLHLADGAEELSETLQPLRDRDPLSFLAQ